MKPRMTYCFVGSSGVGKSSLINALLAEAKAEVGEIGHTAERGRHTTTARQLYMTKEGSIIIDNPGSRAVGVADATTGMEEVFKDIEALSRDCMFSNCLHINDPGCAILAAIKDGRIQQEQYDNYLSLKKESSDFSASGLQKRHAIKQEQRTITAKKHKRSKN